MTNAVIRARESSGLTQQECANALRIDIRTWQRWEETGRPTRSSFELFLLLTYQHPDWTLAKRRIKKA